MGDTCVFCPIYYHSDRKCEDLVNGLKKGLDMFQIAEHCKKYHRMEYFAKNYQVHDKRRYKREKNK